MCMVLEQLDIVVKYATVNLVHQKVFRLPSAFQGPQMKEIARRIMLFDSVFDIRGDKPAASSSAADD
jgi:hypothetical protein